LELALRIFNRTTRDPVEYAKFQAELDKIRRQETRILEQGGHRIRFQIGHLRGWLGQVMDHIARLVCGGADGPSNMQ